MMKEEGLGEEERMAYPGTGVHRFLDQELALGQVVGHAGRRGQLTDCLCSYPTPLTVNAM